MSALSVPDDVITLAEELRIRGGHRGIEDVLRAALECLGATTTTTPCPIAGGEYGDLVRSIDWGATSLGATATWGPELRTTVNNLINSPVPKVLMWGEEHTMIYNAGYAVMAGGNHPYALGRTVQHIWPEIWDFMERTLVAGLRGEVQRHRDLPMVVRRNGEDEDVVLDCYFTPIHLLNGTVAGVMGTLIENTERVATELALARSENELRIITDALPVLISCIDRNHVYRFANSFYTNWFGIEQKDVVGRHVRDVLGEDAYLSRLPIYERVLAGETIIADSPLPHADGTVRASEIRYIPRRDADGSIHGFHVLVFDIEERVRRAEALEREIAHRKRAEEQLRISNETLEARVVEEIAERRATEASLAQAQKMETIGQLTGGVAHDFNNLLQVVSGNLQMLSVDVEGNARAETRVANAMAGVSRGAKLASQLLAFGRRQALAPKTVNPSRFVRDMDDILRQAIGEEIAIEMRVTHELWNTFIDPAQFENALLNLAINARDAMQGNGVLTIEMSNEELEEPRSAMGGEVPPGSYVVLAVADTGSGMPPEIIDKVFEPFFTTKSEGKGSGLGLSMVYGFVKQSGGHVTIDSNIDVGTTMRLYLPRAEGRVSSDEIADADAAPGGDETVLVVEDDAEVRDTVVAMLQELGYRTLQAPDASEALAIIDQGRSVDLIFTDVVMPGSLRSPDLARLARDRLPGVSILFTSGYTDNSVVHGGRLDEGVDLLSKPYTQAVLATRLRAALARRPTLPAPGAGVPQAGGSKPNLMLVEDDALIALGTADMLEDGFAVAMADSAEEALDLLRDGHVDIIVTDLNLPGMSGVALGEEARLINPRVAIVLATGDVVPECPASLHAVQILHKPYDGAGLLRAIDRARAAMSGEPL